MATDDAAAPTLLVPAGKLRDYVHPDILRRDTPEEHVRQRVARSLVEEYGYQKDDLHIEFPIKMGSGPKKRIDIGIFPRGAEHTQGTLQIIIETKREDVRPSDVKDGVGQLWSYLAACINARWGLWVGSELLAYEKEGDPKRAVHEPFPPATDIPLYGEKEPKRLEFAELVPATAGLRKVFRRCYNYLHTNGNLGEEKAFFELLKLIFCKVQDERETSGVMEFSINQDERRSALGQRKLHQRIESIFDRVRADYTFIFPNPAEHIDLDDRSLAYIVQELQKFNFQETNADIKGEAYEEIVSVTSRRDQGAFFTPRNVCDMAVGMLFATYQPARRLELTILDPACGTGGFLRAALLGLKEVITEQATLKWRNNPSKASQDIADRLRKTCDSNLFGIDKLPELVQAAQMNLAMHGDGSSNIIHANSLLSPGEWEQSGSANVYKKLKLNSFDLVVTNPPFGSRLPVDDPHVLSQFELSTFESRNPRSSLPPERLFVERCLRFLHPGGRMAIVLPDSILSNPGLVFIRRWLLLNAYVIASVDLPRETFAKSDTHTKTSVLFLQRFTEQEREIVKATGKPPAYQIFMAIAERVGWDLRGVDVFVRTPEGEEVLQETTRITSSRSAKGEVIQTQVTEVNPIIDDHLPMIQRRFTEWLAQGAQQAWAR
jgi:type I restriction enzyme M protein